jgi:hypothetical protein
VLGLHHGDSWSKVRTIGATNCDVVCHLRHCDYVVALGSRWGVIGGFVETPQGAVRPFGKGVPPSMPWDMSGSLHQIIGYILRDKSQMHE